MRQPGFYWIKTLYPYAVWEVAEFRITETKVGYWTLLDSNDLWYDDEFEEICEERIIKHVEKNT